MRILVLVSVALVVHALSCDRPMGARPPGALGPGPGAAAPAPASGAKACDVKLCHDFCGPANCLFGETGTSAKCMAVCEQRCGDGLFDDQDAAAMACVIQGGHDLACESPKACCEQQMNVQVCAE